MSHRYHVYLGKKRTTISLDDILAELVALKLGKTPETEAAHAAVRRWLQAKIDLVGNTERTLLSQWLQREAMLFIADEELSSCYFDWERKRNRLS